MPRPAFKQRDHIHIFLERELKEEWMNALAQNDEQSSTVIRRFMRQYIKEAGKNRYDGV